MMPVLLSRLCQLAISLRYQILFILSSILYNSTAYFQLGISSHIQSAPDHLFVLVFQNLSISFIKVYLIVSSFILIFVVIDLVTSKTPSYLIQIFEHAGFPINVFSSVSLINFISQNDEPFFTKSWWASFAIVKTLISFFVIIVKNYKLQLRYDNVREKSMAKINTDYQLILHSKLLVNLIIPTIFPTQYGTYIILMTLMTGFGSIITARKIIYESPKIQFLLMFSQVYSWMALLRITMKYLLQVSADPIVFQYIPFVLLLACLMIKPTFIIKLLEAKYLKVLNRLRSQKSISSGLKREQQARMTLTVMTVLSDIFLQTDQSHFNQIKWSSRLKDEFLGYLKENALQIARNSQEIIQYIKKKSLKQKTNPSFGQNSLKSLKEMKHKQRGKLQIIDVNNMIEEIENNFASKENDAYHKRLVYELLWMVLNQTAAFNDNGHNNKETRKLRLFLAYNFPDTINLMKLKAFYCYYLNRCPQQGFFERLQSQICYNFLLSRIGNHQEFKKTHSFQDSSLQGISDECTMTKSKISQMQNRMNENCMSKEKQLYNPKFNDILKESQISNKIINQINDFVSNQKLFLSIFSNPKEQNQIVFTYYEKRNQVRKSIKNSISDYIELDGKKPSMAIFFKYIQNVYLEKKVQLGYQEFQMSLMNFSQKNGNNIQLMQRNNGNASIMSKTKLRNRKNKKLFDTNATLTCVVSGVSRIGQIYLTCSKMRELMGLKRCSFQGQFSSEATEDRQFGNSINDMMLPLWQQEHKQLLKAVRNYEKPIDHISQRYFMLSLRRDNLLEVNFKMYFSMKFEHDLLIILNIEYGILQKLTIQNSLDQPIYQYGEMQQREKSQTNKFELESIQVFGDVYYVKAERKAEQGKLIPSYQTLVQKSICCTKIDNKNEEVQDQIDKRTEEAQFEKYKKKFRPQNGLMHKTIIFGFLSLLILASGILILVEISESNVKQALDTTKIKKTIQNSFCLNDINSVIDIGLAYSFSTNHIPIDQERGMRMKRNIFDSMRNYDLETRSRMEIIQSGPQSNELTKQLFNGNWVNGRKMSFISLSLTHFKDYHQTVQIYADINKLNQIWTTNQQNQNNTNKNSTLHVPDQKLDQLINFQKKLSKRQEKSVMKFIDMVKSKHTQFFSDNGVIDKITLIESSSLARIVSQLAQILYSALATFTFFSSLAILFIVKLQHNLANKYQHAMSFSSQFIKKMSCEVLRLNSLLQQTKNTSKHSFLENIRPQSHKINHTNYIQPIVTAKNLKSSISPFTLKQPTKNGSTDRSLHKTKFIWSRSVLSIFRYFLAIFSLFYAYQDYGHSLNKIQSYTLALSDLATINAKYTKALELSLFAKRNIPNAKQQFQSLMTEIQQDKKNDLIQYLFVDENAKNFILYKNLCEPNKYFDFKCPPFAFGITNGFTALKSQLIHSLHLLQSDQTSTIHANHDNRNLLIQNYKRNKIFLHIISKLSDYTFAALSDYVYSHPKWIYALCVFLLACSYFMELIKIWKSVNLFNEEFLNIGSISDLKKQSGYAFFTNQSKNQH